MTTPEPKEGTLLFGLPNFAENIRDDLCEIAQKHLALMWSEMPEPPGEHAAWIAMRDPIKRAFAKAIVEINNALLNTADSYGGDTSQARVKSLALFNKELGQFFSRQEFEEFFEGKKRELPPPPQTPEERERQYYEYFSAKECLGAIVAIHSEELFGEQQKPAPDYQKIRKLQQRMLRFSSLQRDLRYGDTQQIHRILDKYAPLLKKSYETWRARHA